MKTAKAFLLTYFSALAIGCVFVRCTDEAPKVPQTLSQTLATDIVNSPQDWVEIKSDMKMKVDSESLNFISIAGGCESGGRYLQNKACGICIQQDDWLAGTTITTKTGSVVLNREGSVEIMQAIDKWEDQKRIQSENKILNGICK